MKNFQFYDLASEILPPHLLFVVIKMGGKNKNKSKNKGDKNGSNSSDNFHGKGNSLGNFNSQEKNDYQRMNQSGGRGRGYNNDDYRSQSRGNGRGYYNDNYASGMAGGTYYNKRDDEERSFGYNQDRDFSGRSRNYENPWFAFKEPETSFIEERSKYLEMSLSDKRKYYKCKNGFIPSKVIPDISVLYENGKLKFNFDSEFVKKELQGSIFIPDDELNKKVSFIRDDITKLEVDAVVNAANTSLIAGGGIDRAINDAAGKYMADECKTLDGCEVGYAKISGGYKLPASFCIHTVGPQGEIPSLLQNAYKSSIRLAVENQLRTIAFPCISTGVYGYPNKNAAKVALETVRTMLEAYKKEIDLIIFVVYLEEDEKIYRKYLPLYFPPDIEE